MNLWWVLLLLAAERGLEMLIARHNRQVLLRKGAKEFYPESFRAIVTMHGFFFIALVFEGYPWRVPLDVLTWACLIALVLLQLLRYWCIVSLGRFWNTRIIVLPGAGVQKRGPYRWLRHPNYLVVTLEFLFLPLLFRAPLTLLVFTLANLALLRRRIALEEKALGENTDYRSRFEEKK